MCAYALHIGIRNDPPAHRPAHAGNVFKLNLAMCLGGIGQVVAYRIYLTHFDAAAGHVSDIDVDI
jgi:hypothetical protein